MVMAYLSTVTIRCCQTVHRAQDGLLGLFCSRGASVLAEPYRRHYGQPVCRSSAVVVNSKSRDTRSGRRSGREEPWHAGLPRKAGGTGSGQGGPVTRSGTRDPRPRADSHGPSRARNLEELQQAVERGAGRWAEKGQLPTFVKAFSKATKLPAADGGTALPAPGEDPGLCPQRRAVMHALASAYLPVVLWLKDPIQCLMPLWACAKTGYGWGQGQGDEVRLAEALLGRLAQGGGEMVSLFNGQDHSQLWWSLSEAPQQIASGQGALLAASAARLMEMGAQDLGPQACSNILLACARLLPHVDVGDHARLLHHLTRRLVELAGKSTEQQLTNALYALGRLHEQCGHTPTPEHLQDLVAAVLGQLPEQGEYRSDVFAPQGISNTLWACAKLRYAPYGPLTRLAGAAGEAARSMTDQALSNSVWALGRLVEAGCLDGSSGVPGVQRLADEAQRRARQQRAAVHSQHMSNLLLGLAHLRSAAPLGTYSFGAAVEVLAGQCLVDHQVIQGFTSQQLSNTAWALAKLGYGGQAWYAACVEAALQPGYSAAVSQEWSNLWWALAQARHLPSDAPLLLTRTADAMAALHGHTDAQHCANILLALAALGLYDRRLVGWLLGRMVELLPHGAVNDQDMTNTVWSMAVMGPDALSAHRREVEALLRKAVSTWHGEGGARGAFPEEGLTQLWQAQVELEAHPATEVRALAAILPEATVESGGSLGSAMVRAARRVKQPAGAQRVGRAVAAALQRQQRLQPGPADVRGGAGSPVQGGGGAGLAVVSVAEGVFVPQVCRWLDVEVHLESGRVMALVVYGPALSNQPGVLVGGTLLYRRQLQRVYGEGNVVGVSAHEWEGLGEDVERQVALLQALLLQGGGVQSKARRGAGGQSQQQLLLQREARSMDASLPAPPPTSQQRVPANGSSLPSKPPAAPTAAPPAKGTVRLLQRPVRMVAPQARGDERAKRG